MRWRRRAGAHHWLRGKRRALRAGQWQVPLASRVHVESGSSYYLDDYTSQDSSSNAMSLAVAVHQTTAPGKAWSSSLRHPRHGSGVNAETACSARGASRRPVGGSPLLSCPLRGRDIYSSSPPPSYLSGEPRHCPLVAATGGGRYFVYRPLLGYLGAVQSGSSG